MKALNFNEQQQLLQQLFDEAGETFFVRNQYEVMNEEQAKEIKNNKLFEMEAIQLIILH